VPCATCDEEIEFKKVKEEKIYDKILDIKF